MDGLILVKLGGSLITDKDRLRSPRPEVIDRLAAEVAEARAGLEWPLVIGHGSGSYGHPAAAQHDLREGLTSEAQIPGISLTQGRAAELHRIVFDALRAAGVPAFSIPPSAAAVAEGGRLVSFDVGPLRLALERGLVPLVYGDVVLDRKQGVTICSTESALERISQELAAAGLSVGRAVWAGDTEGVYDGSGRVVPEIRPGEEPELSSLGGAATTDVTGGMAHRVETALRLAERGVSSWIGSGRQPRQLLHALTGRAEGGTRVLPRG